MENRDGAHLLMLIAFSITELILCAEVIVHKWDRFVLPLVVCALVYSWCLTIIQKYSGVQRMWLYAVFMMLAYFYYGIHQSRLAVLSLAIVVIILIYFATRIIGLIWMAVLTYFLTMIFNFARVDWRWESAYQLDWPQLILECALVLMAGGVSHFYVRERNREFKRHRNLEKEMLEQEWLAKEQVNVVSRELGAISNKMTGELIVFRNEIYNDISEEMIPDSLKSIFTYGRVLTNELIDLRDYSDMVSGRTKNEPEVYEILDLLSELRMERQTHKDEMIPNMIFDLDPMVPKAMMGDRNKIIKIMRHLISNGIRYTKKGGIQVKIYTQNYGEQCNLVIEVNDTGIGIVQMDLERLMEDLDNRKTLEYRPGGLGLGLFLTTGFLKCMGGFYRIESKWGRGTSVIVSIPQRVVDAVPCMSFDRHTNICLVYENHKFENTGLNRFYEDLFYNMTTKLIIPAYAIQNEGELRELLGVYRRVCMVVKDYHYMENPDYYEKLDVYLVVLKNSKAYQIPIPFGSAELLLALQECAKTADRRKNNAKAQKDSSQNINAESLKDREIRMYGGRNVMIMTDSMSDLSMEISQKQGIPVIPFRIFTEHANFLDGIEMSQECALSHFRENRSMHSMAPSEDDFRAFFSFQLRYAKQLIYVSTAKRVSVSYERAMKVAEQMENVYVFNSGQVSGGVAMMALQADEKAKEGKSAEEILAFLEKIRPKVRTTFLIDNLDHLAYVGRVSKGLSILARGLMIHPVIVMRRDAMSIGGFYFGSMERAKDRYVNKILKRHAKVDHTRAFVGSVGIKQQELMGLEQRLTTEGHFRNVYLRRASAAISINCGVGTFGIIYMDKQF